MRTTTQVPRWQLIWHELREWLIPFSIGCAFGWPLFKFCDWIAGGCQ